MIFNRATLLYSIEKARLAAETSKTIIEGSECLIFDGDFVHAHDGSLTISVPFKFPVHKKIGINANDFVKLIQKFDKPEVELKTDIDFLLVKCGKAESELTYIDPSIIERIEKSMVQGDFEPLPFNFMNNLAFIHLPQQATAPLNGVVMCGNILMCCDMARISFFEFKNYESTVDNTWWISDESVSVLKKLGEGVSFKKNQSHISFKMKDSTLFTTRLYDHGTEEKPIYPIDTCISFLMSFRIKHEFIDGIFPDEFESMITRASILSEKKVDEKEMVTVKISLDDLTIKSAKKTGKYKEHLDITHIIKTYGNDVEFDVYASSLLSFMEMTNRKFYLYDDTRRKNVKLCNSQLYDTGAYYFFVQLNECRKMN